MTFSIFNIEPRAVFFIGSADAVVDLWFFFEGVWITLISLCCSLGLNFSGLLSKNIEI